MLQTLVSWDVALFRFINGAGYVRELADLIFLLARDQVILMVLLAAGVVYLLLVGWRRVLPIALWGGAVVVLSNLLHNHWLKPFFNRARPFMSLDDMHLCVALNDLSNVSLSFPSTHAASAAGLALVAFRLDPRLRWPALGFALLIGWGTIYSGGHYPSDVLAGYAVGVLLGWGLIRLSRMTWPGVARTGEWTS